MSEEMSYVPPEKYETPKKKILKESSSLSVDENANTPIRRSSRRSVLQSKRPVIEQQHSQSSEDDENNIDIEERQHFKGQFDGHHIDIDGKAVFGFHTPKKKDGMATIAASVCTPMTPRTPKNGKTPDVKRNRNEQALKTPKHVRSKLRKGIFFYIFQ